MHSRIPPSLATRLGLRFLALACAAVAVSAGLFTLDARPTASAQDAACEVTDLGALGGETQQLETTGRWTTEDCDSAFRAGSDAHSYSFRVEEGGRVRIDLRSSGADSYLYLLTDAGERIADDDDGAAGRDARVERDLAPGAYRIEATTVGGRTRGPADFSLSVGYVEGCETIHLGTLTAEADLTATGSWTLETCGSRIVETHPAYNYSFTLPAGGRVRIELTSAHGDPVLSLASPTLGVIGANDDGADGINARIEEYLVAGSYLVEATTYRQGDRQPLVADFELTVQIVDEAAAQNTFILKVEETLAPDVVIAGEPFTVDFRVGNVGGSGLPEDSFVILYAVGPRAFESLPEIPTFEALWQPGAGYHSSPDLASTTSVAVPFVRPIEVVLPRPGYSWIFVGALAFQVVEGDDRYDHEISFHGIWRNLRVLTGPTYGPVTVSVDGASYNVEAADDEDGVVTTTVTSAADAEHEVDAGTEAKATYAAAVSATVLADVFERPGLEGLSGGSEPLEVNIGNASSSTLLRLFAEEYHELLADTGFAASIARREALNPAEVEDFVLRAAGKATRQYASLAASWSALQERVAGGEALSFAEAYALKTELAYAERILAPVATAGNIVAAAREAEAGWLDPRVRAGQRALAAEGTCDGPAALADAFDFAGTEGAERLLALNAELRASLPVFAAGSDAALCGARLVDGENARFLQRFGIESEELAALNAPEAIEVEEVAAPTAPSHRLRIIARLGEDGRVEHAVELTGGPAAGAFVAPNSRFLPADAPAYTWYVTGDVEVGGGSIGQIRSRRLADGRIELGFRDAAGNAIAPSIRYLPADLPVGTWLVGGEIEVPPAAPAPEDEAAPAGSP